MVRPIVILSLLRFQILRRLTQIKFKIQHFDRVTNDHRQRQNKSNMFMHSQDFHSSKPDEHEFAILQKLTSW